MNEIGFIEMTVVIVGGLMTALGAVASLYLKRITARIDEAVEKSETAHEKVSSIGSEVYGGEVVEGVVDIVEMHDKEIEDLNERMEKMEDRVDRIKRNCRERAGDEDAC